MIEITEYLNIMRKSVKDETKLNYRRVFKSNDGDSTPYHKVTGMRLDRIQYKNSQRVFMKFRLQFSSTGDKHTDETWYSIE